MPDSDYWWEVSSFLYSGISEKINLYRDYPMLATPQNIKELDEAIKIYGKKCIVCSKLLKDEFQSLLTYLNVYYV